MDDFLLRALFAGLTVALVTGALGTFVVWRRMAYFGDTLAHSALLGVSLGILLELNLNLAIVSVCLLLALALVALQHQRKLASDTLLGILSHSALALGLVAVSFAENVRIDLMGYLFGDILAVGNGDLLWIGLGSLFALGLLLWLWRPLLAMTVHEELAQVEGVKVGRTRLLFMLLIALVIATAMKVVGILLITSLLIIPAATARHFARTPEQMALLAAVIGMLAVTGGLFGSFQWDLPAGPAIVVTAALLFFLSQLQRRTVQ
ncbi:MAG: zinc ABC transporter permease subunit ZnuB [Gammaproteobacteria bacterium]|nr:zinc ABC transporter permease subunit ZnuB [Gammaproteobacteria bacterium]MCW8840391.1 zinc ABC transporter permease subunit ZnuB [Gammaproteobacteria bacterium]MCW8928118.1 zinc ABC transporter permease subunit ZnuB [Gammaproteobacteria bacterium]MCW8957616.1 zinc ABC transporter permease subunit ZnuB [Gammaproteobacteria bacterium]MCW8972987.1 zinc ABC transporter permease subunit ZnuB [Gammaproteobacteria bacterium]